MLGVPNLVGVPDGVGAGPMVAVGVGGGGVGVIGGGGGVIGGGVGVIGGGGGGGGLGAEGRAKTIGFAFAF